MLNKILENRPKIHTRDIQLSTYPYTDSQVIVHGILKDHRHTRMFDVTGAIKEPGIIHHIDVKMMIKSNPLMIEDAQAQMIHVPLPECSTTLDTIESLKGLEIKSGFSKKIRGIVGGKKGCTHLCQLIVAMGQEIVHGWLTHSRKDKPPVPKDLENLSEKKFLFDSCRMWTRGGPKMKHLEQAIKDKNSYR